MDKLEELKKYSNINKVNKKAKELNINKVYLSTRKDKKYMVLNPNNDKFVHFGQFGYIDFTKSNDVIKRIKFLKRNWKWADAELYTPASLSYYLLW
jgi:hypothetical protein